MDSLLHNSFICKFWAKSIAFCSENRRNFFDFGRIDLSNRQIFESLQTKNQIWPNNTRLLLFCCQMLPNPHFYNWVLINGIKSVVNKRVSIYSHRLTFGFRIPNLIILCECSYSMCIGMECIPYVLMSSAIQRIFYIQRWFCNAFLDSLYCSWMHIVNVVDVRTSIHLKFVRDVAKRCCHLFNWNGFHVWRIRHSYTIQIVP